MILGTWRSTHVIFNMVKSHCFWSKTTSNDEEKIFPLKVSKDLHSYCSPLPEWKTNGRVKVLVGLSSAEYFYDFNYL